MKSFANKRKIATFAKVLYKCTQGRLSILNFSCFTRFCSRPRQGKGDVVAVALFGERGRGDLHQDHVFVGGLEQLVPGGVRYSLDLRDAAGGRVG